MIHSEMRGGINSLPEANDGVGIVEYAAPWLGVPNRQAGNLFAFERMKKSRAAPGAGESHPAPPEARPAKT